MLARLARLLLALTAALPAHAAAPPAHGPRRDLLGDTLPAGALARLGTARLFQTSVDRMAFSPDGTTLASVDGSGTLYLWDVATGKERWRAASGPSPGSSSLWSLLSFSRDGQSLALARGDRSVRIWSVADGRLLRRHTVPFRLLAVQFAPTRQELALGGEGGAVQLLDCKRDRPPVLLAGFRTVVALAYSRDGMRLTVIDARKEWSRAWSHTIWSVPGGKLLWLNDLAHDSDRNPGLSPDGRLFAVVSTDQKSIQLLHPFNGKTVRRIEGAIGYPVQFAFSADGQALTSPSRDGVIRVWSTATGKLLHRVPASRSVGECVALSSDGKRLALYGPEQTIELWDLSGAKPRRAFADHIGHRSGPLAVAFAADGKSVVTMNRSFSRSHPVLSWPAWSFRRWQADTGRQLAVTQRDSRGDVHWTAFSPDGRLGAVVTHEGTVRLWDLEAGKERRSWTVPMRDRDNRPADPGGKDVTLAINHPSFSADGKSLLATEGTWVTRWDVSNGLTLGWIRDWDKVERNTPREAVGWSRCYPSPDGETLLLTGWTGATTRLVLVNIRSGHKVRELADERKFGSTVAFSADGRTLAVPVWDFGATARAIRLVEVATGQERARLVGAPSWGGALAFSPDGRWLAGGGPDGGVRIWQVATGRLVRRFKGHDNHVDSLSFSPDSSRLASAGWDNTALVWDVRRLAAGRTPPTGKLSHEELETLWKALAGADAGRAFAAVWKLAEVPRQSVPFLREQLRARTGPDRPDEPAALRALETLEKAATREARKVLAEVARGPAGDQVANAARGALRRLDRRVSRR